MGDDELSNDQPSSDQQGTDEPSTNQSGSDEPGMDELTLGSYERKAYTPEDMAAPQQVVQAQSFMAHHSGVHGFGIGQGSDGTPCMVLFAEDLPADQVPEILDGLPVRVEGSGEFTAGG
ncbi:hypothetical protein BH23ACT6_BH23ACT6_16100 [soil metagenome]